MTVEELERIEEKEDREFDLITDPQGIKFFLDHIGKSELNGKYGLLLVELIAGEIESMYGHFQHTPYSHYELDKLV